MKQINHLVMAFAAVCLTAGFSSCEKEKEVEKIVEKEVVKEVPVEVPQDNNWSRYQALVTSDVKEHKKNSKVILPMNSRNLLPILIFITIMNTSNTNITEVRVSGIRHIHLRNTLSGALNVSP